MSYHNQENQQTNIVLVLSWYFIKTMAVVLFLLQYQNPIQLLRILHIKFLIVSHASPLCIFPELYYYVFSMLNDTMTCLKNHNNDVNFCFSIYIHMHRL